MKRVGKVIQIIKEKEYKRYGFYEYEDCDYLTIRPVEEREPKRSIRNLLYLFAICFLISGFFAINNHLKLLGWLTFLFFVGMIACVIYNDKYTYENVPKEYWYLESPFPVKNPHNFKVGDVVETKIEIRKKNDN